jgi:hypothetical protein
MHLHNCRCFQEHLRLLLQSLRALCKAPWGAWEHLEVLRNTGEGNKCVWEVCVWLLDQFTFCWCTQWTHSDVWSQLATMLQCSFTIGYRQSEKKPQNCDQRVICNAMCGIGTGHRVIWHQGDSDGSDGALSLWWSQSTRTEMFFADVAYHWWHFPFWKMPSWCSHKIPQGYHVTR